MENISIFLEAARQLGLQNSDLFQTVDLYEGKDIAAVTHTILTLARVVTGHYPANRRGQSVPDTSAHRNVAVNPLSSTSSVDLSSGYNDRVHRATGVSSTGRSTGRPQTRSSKG